VVNEKEPPRGCRSFHVPAEQVIIRIWIYETAKGINRYFKFCSNHSSSVRAKCSMNLTAKYIRQNNQFRLA
jgi:hypothetical protein